jgi:outer membrane protein with beta-barrel domain
VKRLLPLILLLCAPVGALRAQPATVVGGHLGVEFFDTSTGLETSPVIGGRWAWFARNGHGFEVGLEYSETRLESGQLTVLLELPFDDPQTVSERLLRGSVDYGYVGRGGVVRPYVMAGVGYLRGEILLSNRARRIVDALNRTVDTHDSTPTYEAAVGVLVGEERLRFRYDLRLIWIDGLFGNDGTATFQTSGGLSFVF